MAVDLVGVLAIVSSNQCSSSLVFLQVVHSVVCLGPDVDVEHVPGGSGPTK